jgi:hypothetical protein
VIKLMNNPFAPSSDLSLSQNLYKLSGWVTPVSQAADASDDGSDELAFAVAKIHPWSGSCASPLTDYSGWEGLPVTLCTYTDIGITVKTYMLNADRKRLHDGWLALAQMRARRTVKRAQIT